MKVVGCELCEHTESAAWSLVFADARLRVVRVLDAPEFPAFYRAIWNDHVAELSDLARASFEALGLTTQLETLDRWRGR